MVRQTRQRLSEQIAEQLERRIARNADAGLHSIVALAKEYRVSYLTMWQAVHHLADKGVLTCRKGSGIAVKGGDFRRPERNRSESRLFTKLRSMIMDGAYHTGEPFPKIHYFSSNERCSPNTVLKTFRLLQERGLAHKLGKKWIVGKQPSPASPRGFDDSRIPTAVFVVLDERSWFNIFSQPFTSPFVNTLASELLNHRIGLSLAAILPPRNELSALPIGEDGIRQLVRSLGNRYQGAVVAFSTHERLAASVSLLRSFRRPVVMFNFTNEPGVLDEKRRHDKAPYHNLHIDEESAVRLVLESLKQFGHRTIGVPRYTAPGYEWVERRMKTIHECASRFFPDLRIVVVEQTESWWQTGESGSFSRFLAGAGLLTKDLSPTRAMPASPKQYDLLKPEAPSLGSLIVRDNVTAIVALNNDLARIYYCWLKFKGIEVPKDISLIAFDNTPDALTFPITTIDFGFARLGYLASHILIGDIPVRTGRSGNLPGMCELIHRGSVGPPRKTRFGKAIEDHLISGSAPEVPGRGRMVG